MKTLLITLFAVLLGFALLAQQPVTKVKNPCDSIVKAYADSMKTVWKTKHNEIKEAKIKAVYEFIFGKDKDGNIIDWRIYFWAEIVALLSVFVSTFIITVPRGIKANQISPNKFSLRFWWINNKDKIFRWVAILIFIFFICRLSNDYFNVGLSFLFAVTLGATLDQLITWWKNYNQKKIDSFNKSLEKPTV